MARRPEAATKLGSHAIIASHQMIQPLGSVCPKRAWDFFPPGAAARDCGAWRDGVDAKPDSQFFPRGEIQEGNVANVVGKNRARGGDWRGRDGLRNRAMAQLPWRHRDPARRRTRTDRSGIGEYR